MLLAAVVASPNSPDRLVFEVSADGFLYHMVRIMAGTLIEVACGRLEPDDVPETGKEEITEFAVKGCFCLRPSESSEPLAPPDYRFMESFRCFMLRHGRLKPVDWDEYDIIKRRYPLRGNKIGGYMWSTQDDPRMKEVYQKYDTILLQVDSNYRGDCQISFGDDGVCLFLIPKDKLKARDFSDVMFWWDCY